MVPAPTFYAFATSMLPTSRTLRLTLYTLLILAGAALAAGLAVRHAERQALVEDAARANQQLALYANSLHTLIDRYRALPAVLALDPELRAALLPIRPGRLLDDPAVFLRVNFYHSL